MPKNEYQHTRFCLLNTLVSVSIGTLFYVFFRPSSYISLFVHYVIAYATNHDVYIRNIRILLPQVINNYIGDILWSYALTFTLCSVLDSTAGRDLKIILATAITAIISIEYLQKITMFSGVFDLRDICIEIITVSIVILIDRRYLIIKKR